MRMRAFATALMTVVSMFTTAGLAAPPVITNPATAPGHREVSYHEVWRVGADEDGFVFGTIQDAVNDAAGNVYLLDTQQQLVFKFSAAGRYLGTIVRKGEGPGEIDRVYSLEMLGPDSLGLIKGFPGEVIVVALDGTPRPVLRPQVPELGASTAFSALHRLASRDGFIICRGRASHARGQAQDATEYVVSLRPDGAVRHCYGTHRGGYDFTRPVTVDESGDRFAHNIWALGRHGEIYLAPERDRWLIEVRDPDGNLLRTITRDWQPHRRTAEEKEAAKQQFTFSSNRELPPISFRLADTDPVIVSLEFSGDELRVVSTGDEDRTRADFEVCDAAGHLRESRSLRLPSRSADDHLIHLEDGRLVCVKGLYSAIMSASAGWQMQVGDQKQGLTATNDAEVLEVILYAPDGP